MLQSRFTSPAVDIFATSRRRRALFVLMAVRSPPLSSVFDIVFFTSVLNSGVGSVLLLGFLVAPISLMGQVEEFFQGGD